MNPILDSCTISGIDEMTVSQSGPLGLQSRDAWSSIECQVKVPYLANLASVEFWARWYKRTNSLVMSSCRPPHLIVPTGILQSVKFRPSQTVPSQWFLSTEVVIYARLSSLQSPSSHLPCPFHLPTTPRSNQPSNHF